MGVCCVFFFKPEAAYGVRLSFVGSEMCIRDRFVWFVEAVLGPVLGFISVPFTHLTLPTPPYV